jgi:hypothetical protein
MPAKRLYYHLKPYLPWRVRMALRRTLARWQRKRNQHIWPINEAAGITPFGWPGWPDGKKFAFVITHDVEGHAGLAKCRQLMQLEQKLGFRSSFNFIPEGDYAVSRELRNELAQNGFEVGVHDLRHDGKLYSRRQEFAENARSINGYMQDWGACGFRSGFMMFHRESLHDLNILYDASTFDTDPFEPQPQGTGTIFPFWIARQESLKLEIESVKSGVGNAQPAPSTSTFKGQALVGPGYVELPYTLPQDSTLFLVLREKTPEIWFRKLSWIIQQGGMALVNVHPDYLRFPGEPASAKTFPVEYYEKFLHHVLENYAGSMWHDLPRQVATFYKSALQSPVGHAPANKNQPATKSTI